MVRFILTAAMLVSALLFSGCFLSSKAVHVVKVSPDESRAYYGVSGPTVQGLSFEARNYLQTNLLMDTFQNDPEHLIDKLNRSLSLHPSLDLLSVFADVCYALALQTNDPDSANKYYLSAAYGYYRILFDSSLKKDMTISRFEPGILRAAMRYNAAVGMIFQYMNERSLLEKNAFALPMAAEEQVFFDKPIKLNTPFTFSMMKNFQLCANYKTKKLLHFSYNFGLGAPLFAEAVKGQNDSGLKLAQEITLPMTCILRFKTEKNNDILACFEIFDTMKYDTVKINGETVPLTQDFSTPTAYFIENHEAMNLLTYALNPDKDSLNGLYALTPYDKDKIPLVFVHGLMSSPQTWIQLVNTLSSDPVIRRNYQFWYYAYSSGNPILVSAKNLRAALDAASLKHGKNPNFSKMVVVGHSMGGLISKTMLMNSGDDILNKVLGRPWQDAKKNLDAEDVEFLEELVLLKQRDYVSRIVFMAVPHRGSIMADWKIARLGAALVSLPVKMVSKARNVMAKLMPENDMRKMRPLYTGFDNLSPNNPVLKILSETPLAADVPIHSIIGNKDKGGVPGGSDGVVPYESSHLDNVESELVVKSGHSVQGNSETMHELSRILREHLVRIGKK